MCAHPGHRPVEVTSANAEMYDLQIIHSPRLVYSRTDHELKNIHTKSNPCLTEFFLNCLGKFYDGEAKYSACGKAFYRAILNRGDDLVGPRTNEGCLDSSTATGLFACYLQHVVTKVIDPVESYLPAGLVATNQKAHTRGGPDIIMYKRLANGLHPRMMFMCTTSTSAVPQLRATLLACANNIAASGDHGYQLMLVGGVVVMSKVAQPTPPALEMYAYTLVQTPPPQPGDPAEPELPPAKRPVKIAVATIYKGDWTPSSSAGLLRVVDYALGLPVETFATAGAWEIPHFDQTRQTAFPFTGPDGQSRFVTKVIDRRDCGPFEVEDAARRHKGSLKFIPGCTLLVSAPGLSVLRYPLIPGDQFARSAHSFVGVLRCLDDVHRSGWLHLDVRGSNCVFHPEDGTKSALIDFDFAGEEGEATYPYGYNTNIDDGERHPEARTGWVGRRSHDYYSMAAVMRLYQPAATIEETGGGGTGEREGEAQRQAWQDWCARVAEGQLSQVAEEMLVAPDIPLISRQDIKNGPAQLVTSAVEEKDDRHSGEPVDEEGGGARKRVCVRAEGGEDQQ